VFAKVHRKTKQPYVANLFVAAVSLVVALRFQRRLDDLTLFQNFGALSAFVMVNLSVIGYFWVKKSSRKIGPHLILPLIGVSIVLVLLLAMRMTTLAMGGMWLLLGGLYYLTMRFALRRQIALEV
jgi:amino acid transporter